MTEPVPAPAECLVTLWRDDARVHHVRLRPDETLLVGRGARLRVVQAERRVRRLEVPADRPFVSRAHLVVGNGARDTHLAVLREVRNPGKVRQWGQLHWRPMNTGGRVEPRRGLLAFLLPDFPPWVLTATWGTRGPAEDSARSDDQATELESAPGRIDVTPAQREAMVAPLIDAVRWPPSARPGRVRGWAEVRGGPAHRVAYRRLTALADATDDFPWTDLGQRGPDPALLDELIATGSIGYDDVQRGRPWRLTAPDGLISTKSARYDL